MSRFHVAGVLAVSLFLSLPNADASIIDMDSGRSFPSRQVKTIGKHLWRGYEYMARLQYLDANPWLCPSSDPNADDHLNITVPAEGVPVALLVRGGGGCSLEEKAHFVLNNVYPKGVVRYLIVGSGHKVDGVADEDLSDEEDADDSADEDNFLQSSLSLSHYFGDFLKVQPMIIGSTRLGADNDDDDTIPLYFIHVSLHTEAQLLYDLIRTETPETKNAGGPRITIDSRTGAFDAGSALWIAISAMMCACACSFLLIANGNRNGWWEPPEPQQPPPRPTRRRLTREQVKANFPRYLYDEATGTLQVLPEANHNEEEEGLIMEPPPVPLELDCCSICLDEYEQGDKLRCLPCKHAFHARCVGRWLAERSATCPLCKAEILEEEEEEDESVESNHQVGTPPRDTEDIPGDNHPLGWWDRFHRLAGRDASVVTTEDQTDVVEDFPRQTWWSRMFPARRSEESDANGMLTEPLLDEEVGQAENVNNVTEEQEDNAEGGAHEVEQENVDILPEALDAQTRQVTV